MSRPRIYTPRERIERRREQQMAYYFRKRAKRRGYLEAIRRVALAALDYERPLRVHIGGIDARTRSWDTRR